jgi:large subunit ribosomal protein L4
MKLKVYNIQGAETGKEVDLPSEIFAVEPNDHSIYLDVKQYLANQRQGTHKTKDKSEITASTKKIKRQKGTGTARAGSVKSGVMVGGGNIHGPRPRDYSFKLNKKVKQLARISALSHKAIANGVIVLDDINFDQPNTKNFIAMLDNLKLTGTRSLVVVPEHNNNVYLSGRNVQKSDVMVASDINTYQVMKAKTLVITVSGIDKLKEVLN